MFKVWWDLYCWWLCYRFTDCLSVQLSECVRKYFAVCLCADDHIVPGSDVCVITLMCVCAQLIILYPGLMPSNTSFTRAVPPLHDIADIIQLCRSDAVKVQQCKKFLLDYLRHITGNTSSAEPPPQVHCCHSKNTSGCWSHCTRGWFY